MAQNFEVPAHMRQFAEQSVEQAKQAVDGFIAAAHKTAAAIETQTTAAHTGAKDIGQKAMAFAEQNVNASFEYAQRLLRSKDPQEMMQVHAEFVKSQMQVLSEQAKELGQSAAKAVTDSAKPKV